VTWVESVSPSFQARHESQDGEDVARALDQMERTRDRLDQLFPRTVGDVEIVFHHTAAQLDAARPLLPFRRRMDAPAARRYRGGAASAGRIDVLAPAVLQARASAVPGSSQMLARVPDVLYTRLVIAANNRGLPPPPTPRRAWAALRWAWLVEGAAAWFGGQTEHARPAIARRLHEAGPPSFPPARHDAALLGGTVIDLLVREEGIKAAVALACRPPRGRPERALGEAFRERALRHTADAWRVHLARLAGERESRR
jgi:hypothetical protein